MHGGTGGVYIGAWRHRRGVYTYMEVQERFINVIWDFSVQNVHKIGQCFSNHEDHDMFPVMVTLSVIFTIMFTVTINHGIKLIICS